MNITELIEDADASEDASADADAHVDTPLYAPSHAHHVHVDGCITFGLMA